MKLTVHHYHHHDHVETVPAWARKFQDRLDTIMATLDEILADVTDEGTRLDSISTLLTGLRQQLADALAGTTLPPAVQAKVDAIFTAAESNKGKIDTALNSGVPAPPPTPA